MRSQSAWKRRFGDRLAARYSLTWSSRTLSCSVVLALAGMHRLLPSSSSADEAGPLPITRGCVVHRARAVLRAHPPPFRPDATSRGHRLYAPLASRTTNHAAPGAEEGFPTYPT